MNAPATHHGAHSVFDRNLLLYGDNLEFLRDAEQFPTASVDLVYLDPPFNSNADYNVLFKDVGGARSVAQIKAFGDTWSWDDSANLALAYLMQDKHTPANLSALITTFHRFLGHSPMLAYLVQMAVRLVHLRRVLKPTGSLYLHCDPTASHYLKLVLDGIFGPERFRNEIIWQRTSAHNDPSKYGRVHDVLLFYTATDNWTWNQQFDPTDADFFESHDFEVDGDGGHYRKRDLSAPAHGRQTGRFRWKGKLPPDGRMWSYTEENMKKLESEGRIVYTKNGMPRLKIPVEQLRGIPYQDVWVRSDLWLNSAAKERLGYPTQKPLELLKRIIASSSNPGDVILDPFCGCGTTIDAVETLNRERPDEPARRWIGIDITHLAINLIKHRLTRFSPPPVYDVRGEPRDLAGARQLFKDDPYQFQFWACGLVGARPAGATVATPKRGKKGADHGIDGQRVFVERDPQTILVQVKGGKVGAAQVRDFVGTIGRENAAMGIFITLDEPTKPMTTEAASAGVYASRLDPKVTVPKVQIVTIEELMSGGTPRQPSGVHLPPYSDFDRTVKKAKTHKEATLFAKRH